MTPNPSSSPVDPRDGLPPVVPSLVCADAPAALDFYARAFGAVEICRVPGPDGKIMHAMFQIEGSPIMLTDEHPDHGCLGPKTWGGTSVTLHLQTDDADALFARAVAAGATATMPVQEMFWGDRYGQVTDPFGHQWSMATHVRDLTPEQITAAAAQAGCGPRPE